MCPSATCVAAPTASRVCRGQELPAFKSNTFGIYLLHMFFVDRMKFVLFMGNGVLHPFIRMIIYEVVVFGLALGTTWLLRKIPACKKLL